MDSDYQKFGRGPRELTGAVDLINHYKLLPHHNFFCKRSLPVSISDSYYLHNVVGDTEVRKGEGMLLGQLVENAFISRETNSDIQLFELDVLRDAFQLKEAAPVNLPPSEKGIPTVGGKYKRESKEKGKRHKKHKDKDKEKKHKKSRHRHKDRSKDKDRDKEKKKKRKHDGDEDTNTHKDKKKKTIRPPTLMN